MHLRCRVHCEVQKLQAILECLNTIVKEWRHTSSLSTTTGVGRVECGIIFNINQHYLEGIPTYIGVSHEGKRKEAILFSSFGPKSLCEKG